MRNLEHDDYRCFLKSLGAHWTEDFFSIRVSKKESSICIRGADVKFALMALNEVLVVEFGLASNSEHSKYDMWLMNYQLLSSAKIVMTYGYMEGETKIEFYDHSLFSKFQNMILSHKNKIVEENKSSPPKFTFCI